ncbi:DUF459 domain-containing protein [Mesorhizobium sp. NBSH29]|uniref:DUF459 domain-containing protein n=1 Tax=Mesorhizobium sp. NBSH29 TaxID=2654249 RepID=UPI0018967200|nr:DUF459 domain-containing protein [Mesorhizobium sp. NBSH29]
MISNTYIFAAYRRLTISCLALALALPFAASFTPEALAQDSGQPRRTFLQRLLFGDDKPEQPRQLQRAKPRQKPQKSRTRRQRDPEPTSRRTPAAKRADTPIRAPAHQGGSAALESAVEKREDARKVVVVGDFLGSGLAEGLIDAYAGDDTIVILDRTNGSSGLVREDHYNWPTELVTIIEAEKPAAVVAMIGSNDRQQMATNTDRLEKFSDAWTTEYERRANAFAKAARSTNAPLIWVGMPAFKSSSMTSDMLTLNDIFARTATTAKAEFVDIWDGFVDENGVFVFSGPDMNGQPVRLRGSDGINLTQAARRKVAFYVEKPLNKLLGNAATEAKPGAPYAPAGLGAPAVVPDIMAPDLPPKKIERTPPMALNDPDLDGGSELLGAVVTQTSAASGQSRRIVLEGIGASPPAGRADDFSASALRDPSPLQSAAEPTAGTEN